MSGRGSIASSNKCQVSHEFSIYLDQFCLDNYEFIMKEHSHPEVAKVYRELGPFDFNLEIEDEDLVEKRINQA